MVGKTYEHWSALQFGANTFFGDFELSRLGNLDGLRRLIARALGAVLDLLNDVVALEDLAEDDVLAVQPGGDDGCDEELRAVLNPCQLLQSSRASSVLTVSLPEFAMDNRPFLVCFNLKFSSWNFSP